MAKNTSYPPIKDGVKADNSTYSSNQIDRMISEVEESIPDLPEAEVSNIGKVLGIVSDGSTGAEYGTISIENELPEPTGSNLGRSAVVKYNSETDIYYWGAENVKSYTSYVLSIVDYGTPSVSGMTAAAFEEHIYNMDHIVCQYTGSDIPNYGVINLEPNGIDRQNNTINFIGYWLDANNDPYGVMIQVHSNGSALSISKKKFEMIQEYEDITGTLISGKYINTDGTEGSDSGWSCTDFIDVGGSDIVVISANANPYNSFYDDSKNHISAPSGIPTTWNPGYNEVSIPSSAKYFRFSDTTVNMGYVKIMKKNT